MLIFKPLILWWRMPKVVVHEKEVIDENIEEPLNEDKKPVEKTPVRSKEQHGDEHDDISEIAVHQIIETI